MSQLVQHNHAFRNSSQNKSMDEDNDGDPFPALAERVNEDIDEDLLLDLAERERRLCLQSIKAATRKSYTSYWKQQEIFFETNGVPTPSIVTDKSLNHTS